MQPLRILDTPVTQYIKYIVDISRASCVKVSVRVCVCSASVVCTFMFVCTYVRTYVRIYVCGYNFACILAMYAYYMHSLYTLCVYACEFGAG